MQPDYDSGTESPAGTADPVRPTWRIDDITDEQARERHRRDAAGASRDITAALLAGGI